MKKRVSLATAISSVIIACVITFTATFYLLNSKFEDFNQLIKDKENIITKLIKVDELVKKEFVGEISDNQLIDGMISGYMSGLDDKFSMYLDKETFDDMMKSTEGNFEGIGVTVDLSDVQKGMVVTYVMPNSPAEKAGILADDAIIRANGKQVNVVGAEEAMSEIAGPEGTMANFTILRKKEEIDFSVKREVFDKTPVLPLKIINDNIAFIRIMDFDEKTAGLFKKELDRVNELQLKGIIFDVRNNPGGELQSIIDCLDMLMPKGNLVTLKYKTGLLDKDGKEIQPKIYTTEGKNELQLPAVVLTNGNTASAAELFCSDMQDAKKATLVGTKTYGKQVGQTTFMVTEDTAIKLTTFNYLARNESNFNKIGIQPDIEVKMSQEKTNKLFSLPSEEDEQLKKATEILSEKIKK